MPSGKSTVRTHISQAHTLRDSFQQAYIQMAKEANYRPAAPNDGFGNITGPSSVELESALYASWFEAEDNLRDFYIGCCDLRTARAFVWVVEAARQLSGGEPGNATTVKLLKMATKEIERAGK